MSGSGSGDGLEFGSGDGSESGSGDGSGSGPDEEPEDEVEWPEKLMYQRLYGKKNGYRMTLANPVEPWDQARIQDFSKGG